MWLMYEVGSNAELYFEQVGLRWGYSSPVEEEN